MRSSGRWGRRQATTALVCATLAAAETPAPPRSATPDSGRWALAPLALGLLMLLVGSVVGLLFTLDTSVADQRLGGLALDAVVGLAVVPLLWRASDQALLVSLAAISLLTLPADVWIIAVSGPDLFRGILGGPLRLLTLPLQGRLALTAPVEYANTWFIVGYNGLADLCLLAVFSGVAICLARAPRRWRWFAGALIAGGTYVLLGTGARGPLAGLVLGTWMILILVWRRGWLLGIVALVAAVALAASGLLDKGLDVSSTTGRFEYWGDLGRLLVEYPFTGLGLGVDTPNKVALFFEINPDPQRIAYAHNTFVQAYLEQGPLGLLGMIWLPLVAVLAAAYGLRGSLSATRRALLLSSLGLLLALEVHGFTDQVLTTNVGDGLLFLSVAGVVGALASASRGRLADWAQAAVPSVGVALVATGAIACLVPQGHLLLTRNLAALDLDSAILRSPSVDQTQIAQAETGFETVLAADPTDPVALRDLARAHLATFDVSNALAELNQTTQTPGLDPFDMLQIAHLYRDLGFADQAYSWASSAYATWGRVPSEVVMLTYEQATVADNPNARVLAQQAEAASSTGDLQQALSLFQQALAFAPGNAYLQERIDGTQRGIDRQPRLGAPTPAPSR